MPFHCCDEETLTPYQPMVEMLRGWSAGAPLDSLRDRLGPRADELAILLPEFGAIPSADTVMTGADADAQRFRFFDSVGALRVEELPLSPDASNHPASAADAAAPALRQPPRFG